MQTFVCFRTQYAIVSFTVSSENSVFGFLWFLLCGNLAELLFTCFPGQFPIIKYEFIPKKLRPHSFETFQEKE